MSLAKVTSQSDSLWSAEVGEAPQGHSSEVSELETPQGQRHLCSNVLARHLTVRGTCTESWKHRTVKGTWVRCPGWPPYGQRSSGGTYIKVRHLAVRASLSWSFHWGSVNVICPAASVLAQHLS